jgi:type II secretory pathway component GspD/PulD (secretin)
LFKRKVTDDAKTELIIFLTPTIVRDSTQLANVTATEHDKAEAQKKAFSEEELHRYLDGLPVKDPDKKPK